MKQGIHPEWFDDAKVICACGAVYNIGSTKPETHVEICATCHPFFTGEAKYIDVLGRVDTFQQKQKKSEELSLAKKEKIRKEKEEEEFRPKSLKELLAQAKKTLEPL